MSVRKRGWRTSKGEAKEAWIVDYVDQQGDRHIETFERKKDADDFRGLFGKPRKSSARTTDDDYRAATKSG